MDRLQAGRWLLGSTKVLSPHTFSHGPPFRNVLSILFQVPDINGKEPRNGQLTTRILYSLSGFDGYIIWGQLGGGGGVIFITKD